MQQERVSNEPGAFFFHSRMYKGKCLHFSAVVQFAIFMFTQIFVLVVCIITALQSLCSGKWFCRDDAHPRARDRSLWSSTSKSRSHIRCRAILYVPHFPYMQPATAHPFIPALLSQRRRRPARFERFPVLREPEDWGLRLRSLCLRNGRYVAQGCSPCRNSARPPRDCCGIVVRIGRARATERPTLGEREGGLSRT